MAETKVDFHDLPDVAAQALAALNEAKALLQSGQVKAAQDACRDLLARHGEYVEALCTLGRAHMAAGSPDSALPCFVRASIQDPENAGIFAALSEVYYELNAGEAALEAAREALSLNPGKEAAGVAHLVLGRLFENACDYEKAIPHLEKAAKASPGASAPALLLGACHMEQGDRDKASRACQSALKAGVSPQDHAHILYHLSSRPGQRQAKKLLSQIDNLENGVDAEFAGSYQKALFKARLDLARASAFESLGEYEKSWRALETGNAPLQAEYARSLDQWREETRVSLARAQQWEFAGPAISADGTDVPLSLFILGPSRAGKTTLERLLSTVPGVRTGRESEVVRQSVARTSRASGLMALTFPGQLPTMLREAFTKTYAEEIVKHAEGADVFTITHPGMITDLGRIAETVPNMKVVFVERALDDAALRIFGKVYPDKANPFSGIPEIYGYLENYEKLASAWTNAIPDMAMRVSYEDMIADPAKTRARIAGFCGLTEPQDAPPQLGDDRNCAGPYREFLEAARPSAEPAWQL